MRKKFFLLSATSCLLIINACKKDNALLTTPQQTNTDAGKSHDKDHGGGGNQNNPMPSLYDFITPSYVEAFLTPNNNPATNEGVALGRKLFYEKMLSNNSTISCASCHKQEKAFSDPRRFSLGTAGNPGNRNAMAIINPGWNTTLFWEGRRSTLEEQAHDPVTNPVEMANTWPVAVQRLQQDPHYPDMFEKAFGTRTIDSTLVVQAISQFERTFISFNSRFDQQEFLGQNVFTAQEARGRELFFGTARCSGCHKSPLMTDFGFRNIGLDAIPTDSGRITVTHLSTDYGKFKTPTLRNIALTAPYMHDGRFSTLRQVVDFYTGGVQANSPNVAQGLVTTPIQLSDHEKEDLIAFLETLTDNSFVTNPELSRPNP